MTSAFDDRLLTLTVNFNGQTIAYDQSFYILAQGMKYTDGSLGECLLRIDNISKATRDLLVTKTSPWVVPRTYANIALDVGRKSYGTFRLFEGQATASNPTQPPDIGLVFTSLTQSFLLGNVGSLNMGPVAKLSAICGQVAASLNMPLDFQATDKNIVNYSFSGALLKQVQKLNDLGGICAFVDTNKLIVIDSNKARKSVPVMVNASTGMIGVPEVTETGVYVKMLINNQVRVGDAVTVESAINPAANGTYIIFKLGFEIASRELPFYWKMELKPQNLALGFLP